MENNEQVNDAKENLLKTAISAVNVLEDNAKHLKEMKFAFRNLNQKIINEQTGENKKILEDALGEVNKVLEDAENIKIESLPKIIDNLRKNVEGKFNK